MSSQPKIPPYPSVGEFNGYYNIAPRDDDRIWCSVENPPEWGGFPEWWPIYQDAVKWFSENIPSPGANDAFYIAERDVFVPWDDADDRTMRVEHIDYSRLTLELLHRLQREFLGKYPLWRVHMIGEDDSTGIVIYPTVIRFGSRPADMDLEEALRQLIPEGMAQREAYYRPKRAYLATIQRLLPGAVHAIEGRRFLVFAVLDRMELNAERPTVCMLTQAVDRNEIAVQGPGDPESQFIWVESDHAIDANGEIVDKDPPPGGAPFYLLRWLPPADYRGPLTIIERDTGTRHGFEVKSEYVIRVLPEG